MPTIKLTKGTLRYKTIPIYAGVKRINKVVAFENLCILQRILDANEVSFQLTFGTLLGAVREKDFIDHDEDIDLLILGEDKQGFFDTLPLLIEAGFKVARYDRRGLMSIIRNDEYIDFYFMDNRGDGTRYCSGIIYPVSLTDQSIDFDFKGLKVKIPEKYEEFLRYEYGENWKTPIQYFNYSEPKYKRLLGALKSRLKEMLPDNIYICFAQSSEKKIMNKYLSKLEKYREENSLKK